MNYLKKPKHRCEECGQGFEYYDMHYYWDNFGRQCRGAK